MFNPESIASFPASPGVYVMRNTEGEVIYVGKAANLRQRVKNYFARGGDGRMSIPFLVKNVASIDTIVTATEKEAFLLENTLIKQHRPRYNIRLRDDKTYVSLRFKMNHPYPRLEVTRVRKSALGSAGSVAVGSGQRLETEPAKAARTPKSPDLYFGPYTSSAGVRETMRFLLKVFPVRTCRDSVFRNRSRPCILFDVGKCCGPWYEPVEKTYYDNLVQKVSAFLRGKSDEARNSLHDRMMELSENMEFEKAALIRDRINALDRTLELQQTESHHAADRDILAIASRQGRSLVIVQQIRNGVLLHSHEFYLKNYQHEDPEIFHMFISQHYDGVGTQTPPEILVNVLPEDSELLQEWLCSTREASVRLHLPQRGKLTGLVHTALQNARIALNRRLNNEKTEEETLQELQRRLNLDKEPKTIECLDISNIMGVLAVGSIVRFEDGKPDKTGYRLYRIRTVEGANDFAMMREVIMRRFRPDSERAREHPDVFMVDGGKGQLAIAEDAFNELGITNVQLAAIAKSRLKVRDVPRRLPLPELKTERKPVNNFFPDAPDYVNDAPVNSTAPETKETIRFRTEERIFMPGRKNPVTFPFNSPALFLLERIRDETHRTAIEYHRKLRGKANRHSVLDEVPGVGPRRKNLLLKHFGSLAGLKLASLDELKAVAGIQAETAGAVYQYLHPPNQDIARLEVTDATDLLELEDDPDTVSPENPVEEIEDMLDPTDRRSG